MAILRWIEVLWACIRLACMKPEDFTHSDGEPCTRKDWE